MILLLVRWFVPSVVLLLVCFLPPNRIKFKYYKKCSRRKDENFQLTGHNLVKTRISPLGSTVCLASRVSITIDLAGNHELT